MATNVERQTQREEIAVVSTAVDVSNDPSSLTDLHMGVVGDRGRERSRAEIQALLRVAGLTPTTVHQGATGLGLVAATV
jgi:hypothetical protein